MRDLYDELYRGRTPVQMPQGNAPVLRAIRSHYHWLHNVKEQPDDWYQRGLDWNSPCGNEARHGGAE